MYVNRLIDYKGYFLLLDAWRCWAETGRKPANVVLCLKGSGRSDGKERVYPEDKVVINTELASAEEMQGLYASANVFVNPTMGEAWGLTLTEAFASGLPAIWTHSGAFLDFADESIGYPITKFEKIPLYFISENNDDFKKHEIPQVNPMRPCANGAKVDPYDLMLEMERVYHHYPEALARGRLASERMREKYTWRQAGERFLDILESVV